FSDHDVCRHACQIGLEGERQQVEHQLNLLGEILEFSHGSIRNLQTRNIRSSSLLSTPLDLADGFEVAVEYGAVVISEFALEFFGAVPDKVQDAVSLAADECTFLRRVSFTEKLEENFARIVFHRQRRFRIAEGQRGV